MLNRNNSDVYASVECTAFPFRLNTHGMMRSDLHATCKVIVQLYPSFHSSFFFVIFPPFVIYYPMHGINRVSIIIRTNKASPLPFCAGKFSLHDGYTIL